MVTCYEIANASHLGRAVDARTRMPWRYRPRSTPTISGGRVFAIGATGIVQCLNGATGELIWSHDLLEMYGITQKRRNRK